jgi:dephospho-CoA kinase
MTKVITIVGPMASGKGTLVTLLQENNYIALSLSDVVREKTRAWGLSLTRENLQNVGDQLRQKFGSAILSELIMSKIEKHSDKKYVIDGVRNPAELVYLKKHFQPIIIGVVASSQKRFHLMQIRSRAADPKSRKEFDRLETRDRGIDQASYGQQVNACLQFADMIIDNNGTLDQFKENLSYFLKQIV